MIGTLAAVGALLVTLFLAHRQVFGGPAIRIEPIGSATTRGGGLDGDRVAASLNKMLLTALKLRFIFGDVSVETVDFDGGSQFPAGSAA